jgi:DNA repair protein RecN (Recombination protein N)
MLRQLSVQNFAIVDRVDLEFEPGFNVLTGETGAGKSLLVDALYFLLGERLDPSVLRSGAEKASAEALFQMKPSSPALAKVAEWGFDTQDGEILLRREYSRSSGKTRSTVNGSLATASMASELADLLVDLHGQHEHQAIFNVGRHRRLVDTFGSLEKALERTASAYRTLANLLDEKNKLGGDARDAARRQDLLSFQVQELESAGLDVLDETTLQNDYQAAKHAGKLTELLTTIQDALDGGVGGGATNLQGLVVARLQEASRLDESMGSIADQARLAQESLNQLSFDVSRRLEMLGASENRLAELADQIDRLHTLKKKYGDSLNEVRAYLDSARQEWSTLQGREERLKNLDAEINAAAKIYASAAETLSAGRVKAGVALAAEIQKLLSDLGLSGAKLDVRVEPLEQPGSPVLKKQLPMALSASGWDQVEFQFAANPGEPMRPLAKVASGGEASRIMLALKAALAGADDVATLVFDEIDTGVGARTASAVGKVMAMLAKEKQVLCISHLAPLARLGLVHYRVLKEVLGGKTFTRVESLAGQDRVEELARMLGGEPVTEASRRHALELLKPDKS